MLGGSWISPSCESFPGGVWLRRQLRIYAGDKLWTGRWDYFSDPRCSIYVYGITAAGSYVQRSRRHRRHNSNDVDLREKLLASFPSRIKRRAISPKIVKKPVPITKAAKTKTKETKRSKRSLDEIDYYQQLLQSARPSMAESFAAMLRGNQRKEETSTQKLPMLIPTPSGTSELDLHVAESLLIAGDVALAKRCGAILTEEQVNQKNPRLTSWPSNCVPHTLEAPSTVSLRVRINVDWYGHYNLLLGHVDKHLWQSPLMQCGTTSLRNPQLRSHLRRSVGLRFGILFNKASSLKGANEMIIIGQVLLVWIFSSFFASR